MFNRCSIFTTKYFFTFEDIVSLGISYLILGKSPFNIRWLKDLFVATGIDLAIPSVIYKDYDYNYSPTKNYTFRSYISDLFQRLYARFWKEYVFVLDTDSVAGSEYNNAKKEFYTKLGTIIMNTHDRYSKLLDTYTSELSKLLDGVQTTTQGIGSFNDTPQNIQTSQDDYSGDSHISNISKSSAVATSDLDTKMGRIDEIQRKLRNIWKDWLDEFETLFLERGNVE